MLALIARELGELKNSIVIEGHTDSRPYAATDIYSNWELSADRANAARRVMERSGLHAGQVRGVRGYADRQLRVGETPLDRAQPARVGDRRAPVQDQQPAGRASASWRRAPPSRRASGRSHQSRAGRRAAGARTQGRGTESTLRGPRPGAYRVRPGQSMMLPAMTYPSRVNPGNPAVDPEAIEQLRFLEDEDQPNVVAELVLLFVEHTPPKIAAIRDGITQGDAGAVKRAAHSLKGSSANVGATGMQHVCEQIEQAAAGGDSVRPRNCCRCSSRKSPSSSKRSRPSSMVCRRRGGAGAPRLRCCTALR